MSSVENVSNALGKHIVLSASPLIKLVPAFELDRVIATPNRIVFRALKANSSNKKATSGYTSDNNSSNNQNSANNGSFCYA